DGLPGVGDDGPLSGAGGGDLPGIPPVDLDEDTIVPHSKDEDLPIFAGLESEWFLRREDEPLPPPPGLPLEEWGISLEDLPPAPRRRGGAGGGAGGGGHGGGPGGGGPGATRRAGPGAAPAGPGPDPGGGVVRRRDRGGAAAAAAAARGRCRPAAQAGWTRRA